MGNNFSTIWFFIIFIPMIYAVYNLFKIFDYEKVLRKGKIEQLKILLAIISTGISFLFAISIVEVIERISKFF